MSARQPLSGYWAEVYMPGSPSSEPRNPEREALNARLNASETMLRNRIGEKRVDELIEQFMAAGKKDPALFAALYKKRDPYRWLAQYWAPKQQRRDH